MYLPPPDRTGHRGARLALLLGSLLLALGALEGLLRWSLFGGGPRRLAALLEDREVLDLGVGSYGLDQVVLRVEDRAAELPAGSRVLVGVMTEDIDRSVLRLRSAPKPWLSVEEDGLVLHTEHLEEPPAAWMDRHRPAIRSYVLARMVRTLRLQAARLAGRPHPDCRVEEKERLGRALLARLATGCRVAGWDCRVVLFHRIEDLERPPDWRVRLVEEAAAAEGLPLIDTRPMLEATGDGARAYGPDRHPNACGNQLLAEGIARALEAAD